MICYLPWSSLALLPNSLHYTPFSVFLINISIHCVFPLRRNLRNLSFSQRILPSFLSLICWVASILTDIYGMVPCTIYFTISPASVLWLHCSHSCLSPDIFTSWTNLLTVLCQSKSCITVSLYFRPASRIPSTFSRYLLLDSLQK